MSTLDKICALLEQNGKKQKDLTDFLGISKNSFTDWKSGRIKSYNKHLPEIAKFLGVSVDYLLGVEKKSPVPADSDEALMFALYGNDNKDVTPELLDEVRAFAKFARERKKDNK